MVIDGQDIPIVKLKPLRRRKISKREHDRIAASILAVGLIEPLVVYAENGAYVILNGYQRYCILLEMGIETVPCIVWKQKEAFTANRMVNRLSPVQESRMIQKSLQELDEATIAKALGVSQIGHRLNKGLLKQLHPKLVAAFDAGTLTKASVQELSYVKPERQEQILSIMESCKDFSIAFVRTLVLKTPISLRSRKRKGPKNPWNRSEEKKKDLLKKLKEAEEKHDFYSGLYRQYSINLLKLVIYARSLIANERVEEFLTREQPEILNLFKEIIACAER